MLLSVIIPVYNVAGTLQRCVDSVLAQHITGDDDGMEVIIVDDGSTDKSSVLCDKYAGRQHVHVIHQANAGLSEARNAGLKMATGEYFYKNTIPKILSDTSYTDPLSYWLDGQAYAHTYAWNKIYKRSLFHKIYKRSLFQHVQFPKGKKFEDVPTLWALLQKAQHIRTTALCFYHYTYNANGITQRARDKSYRDLLEAHLPIINDQRLRTRDGFAEYYRHVLDIQLQTYIYSGDSRDIKLPVLPFYGSLKLKLMHLLGLPLLCKSLRFYHLVARR